MAARKMKLSVFRYIYRNFSTTARVTTQIKAGSRLPDINLYTDTPKDEVNIAKLFQGKKGILFAVPGAYTPGCAQAHIPEYLQHWEMFMAEGIEVMACVAVNDPFVMSAWGKEVDPEGKMNWLADTHCEFTKFMGMELDAFKLLGNTRSKRYSLIVEDSVIKTLNMEPDDTGLACLLCIRSMKQRNSDAVLKKKISQV